MLYRIAPEMVYDYLKVIWPNYNEENKVEALATMIHILAAPDCVRWLSENMGWGDSKQLDYIRISYGYTLFGELPEWLDSTENRLLLIYELVSRLNVQYHSVEVTETLSRVLEVPARTEQEALSRVSEAYRMEEIVLTESDFVDKTIKLL